MNTWPRYKLEDIFYLQMGKTPARNNATYWNNGKLKWISIADIGKADYHITDTKEYISLNAVSESGIKPIPAETLIMSFKLSIGKVAVTTEEMYSNEAIMAFVDKKKIPLHTPFLYHLFLWNDWTHGSNKAVMGTTLNKATLKTTEIAVPDIDLQVKIASRLNIVTQVIATREKQLQKFDLLAKSRFIEMFGDPELNTKKFSEEKLENLFRIGSSKRILQSEQVLQGVPFLRISDLMQRIEGKQNTVTLFVSEAMFAQLQKGGLVPKSGDILITSRGTLGRCYVIQPDDRFYFQDGMISWLSERNSAITNTYLVYLFQMPRFRKQMAKMLAGSTVAYLSIAMLKKIQVPLPPLALQNEFAAFIEQLDKSKVTIRKSLEKLNLTYRALLQEYFG